VWRRLRRMVGLRLYNDLQTNLQVLGWRDLFSDMM
jgi:hypothetical protein